MVLGRFVGGFGWFWVVLGGFGSFWVVPCFSNYQCEAYLCDFCQCSTKLCELMEFLSQ